MVNFAAILDMVVKYLGETSVSRSIGEQIESPTICCTARLCCTLIVSQCCCLGM